MAFGACSVPAGWVADKWSRKGMMVIFFIGIGLSSILTSLAKTPIQIGIGLFSIGLFAGIYHPVDLALVVQGREKAGVPVAIIVTFSVMASSLPIIALIHARWGFDSLFVVLSAAATCIFASVLMLPRAFSGKHSL